MWVEVLAFLFLLAMGCLVPTQLVELGEKVELLKSILTFIGECPKWLDYRNRLDENVKTLDKKVEALCCRRDDVNEELATAELESRTKRKREVGYWLQNVEILASEADRITQGFEGMNFLKHAWQGSQVEKKIKEVDKLYKEGRFEEGLVLKSLRTNVDALLTKTLLDTQQMDVERIWECVMNDDAFIIGVTGEQGIGKTSIIEHIYNRLIDSNFDCVFVTISEEYSSRKLQNDIAKQIIPSFVDEEDERKRVAMLYKWLRREKSVLILDGLSMHVSLDKIGISTQMNGCKLILTSRSLEVCRRMSCRQTIKVAPLPSDEAEKLFMNEVRLNDHCNPEIKIIAEQIVNECAGLPLSIFNTAERLMGVDDIYEWRTMLNELREHGPIH